MKLAIFDVDGTLVRGSSERLFWRYLAGARPARPAANRRVFAIPAFATCRPAAIHTLKKNKAYLCGLGHADVATLADEFVATRLMPRLVRGGRAAAAAARAARRRRRAAHRARSSRSRRRSRDRLGVRHVCATLCSERNGRYLAQPPETHPFGAAKLGLSRQLAAQIGADLESASRVRRLAPRPVPARGRERAGRGVARRGPARSRARARLGDHRRRASARERCRTERRTCKRAGCSRRGRTARCDCAPKLRRVERLVGRLQHLFDAAEPPAVVVRGHPDRDRHREVALHADVVACLLKRTHDPLADRLEQRVVRVREHEHEFLAAVARDDVRRAHVGLEDVRRRHEDLIADRVTERVVDRLEAIEIRERDAERRAVLRAAPGMRPG